jgi:hypothetical protein
MRANKSAEYSVIALYGIAADKDAAGRFHGIAMRLLNKAGLEADLMGSSLSKQLAGCASVEKKLLAVNYAGVTHLSVVSLLPGSSSRLDGISMELGANFAKGDCSITCSPAVATLDSDFFTEAASELVRATKPTYGIGFTRPFNRGPTYYAMGLAFGNTPEKEAREISQWAVIGMPQRLYDAGQLRDVYVWNLLNRAQLTAKVGDTPFEQWVKKDPKRGRLSRYGEQLNLWTIDKDQLAAVRQELRGTGIIFDPDRWYRERRAAHAASEAEVLRAVLGEDAESAKVLKVEKGGKARELSKDEVSRALGKKKGGPPKAP